MSARAGLDLDVRNSRSVRNENTMLKYVVALGLVGVSGLWVGAGHESGCPADAQRRQSAVRFARAVNTAEASFHTQNQRYGQIGDLGIDPEPDGFQAQLSSNGSGYNFSVKDTVDACHFALFSDQQGVIFVGQPLR
jgi:hypothetical protein